MMKKIKEGLIQANNVNKILTSKIYISLIEKIIKILVKSIRSGGKVIFCGNGGSASDSLHLAAELIGRFKKKRKAISAISLNSEISTITAIANDFGYEKIFERQLGLLEIKEIILIAISAGGTSKNIIKVLSKAKKMQIKSILLTSEMFKTNKKIADIMFKAPTEDVARTQEVHILIGHLICEALEKLHKISQAVIL